MNRTEKVKLNVLGDEGQGSTVEGDLADIFPQEKKGNGSAAEDLSLHQSPDGNLSEIESVVRIRDILFGAQMREYEKRFSRLEERIFKEVNELRDESKKRFESLENYFKREAESLSARVKSEQEDRNESVQKVLGDLKDTTTTFEKRVNQLNQQVGKEASDLRQQILDQSKNLSDSIREKNDESSAQLRKLAQELRTDKVDRTSLSELLVQMAMHLNNDMAQKIGFAAKDRTSA